MMARRDVAGVVALLDELFNHAQGDLVAACDLVAGAFATVIGSKDPFTQIHREFGHALIIAQGTATATNLFKIL